jgi:alkaline phosphatase
VIFGGGRDFFGAGDGTKSSCNRVDGKNLIEDYLKQFSSEKVVKYVRNNGELKAVDLNEVDHIMGLFANDHLDYESERKKDLYGQPSLSEMTRAAIEVLSNKKNENGYIMIVEGGLIDQAHHLNHAKFALEEFLEMEKAVKVAKDMTSSDDTLIIVTADHGHSMVFHGYPARGNDILGSAGERNNKPFETLLYGNGKGYSNHLMNDSTPTSFVQMEIDFNKKRNGTSFTVEKMAPSFDATHGGEDVGVFAGEN